MRLGEWVGEEGIPSKIGGPRRSDRESVWSKEDEEK
jgi:hypothetical protein